MECLQFIFGGTGSGESNYQKLAQRQAKIAEYNSSRQNEAYKKSIGDNYGTNDNQGGRRIVTIIN
ncbi:hypothetical protein [Pedobacter changchengzhani]|uniref:hypothetical protein n=1 Tax=Pedobacter changchengzhani TaxID=2529274 RepID=UPI001404E468|nr:hypothetical protein [Pedobacter changchengzhani]